MAAERKGPMGSRQFRLFSLFGFEVKLDLSWLLLALLISWSLGAGMFPAEFPGLSSRTYAWMGVIGALGVFFSIVFHEFSHSLVARHYGMQIKGITLFVFGGIAEMEGEPPSPKSEFLMAVAGPLASFLLAFVFSRIEAIALLHEWPTPVVGVSNALAYINTVVAIFNLVPAFPLDGGRMLRAALWHIKKDMHAATRISSKMGSVFGLVLIFLGVFAFIQGNIIGGMWWFLIGIFVRGAAQSSYQRLVLHDTLHEQSVSRFMRRDPETVPPSVTVQDVMKPCSDDNTISADMETEKLLTSMMHPGRQSRYMVVDDGQLVGVIALKDVLELIALKMEIEKPATSL